MNNLKKNLILFIYYFVYHFRIISVVHQLLSQMRKVKYLNYIDFQGTSYSVNDSIPHHDEQFQKKNAWEVIYSCANYWTLPNDEQVQT